MSGNLRNFVVSQDGRHLAVFKSGPWSGSADSGLGTGTKDTTMLFVSVQCTCY